MSRFKKLKSLLAKSSAFKSRPVSAATTFSVSATEYREMIDASIDSAPRGGVRGQLELSRDRLVSFGIFFLKKTISICYHFCF